jgi:hypothetical protein
MVPVGLLALWMTVAPPWRPAGQPPHEGDTARRLRLFIDIEAAHWVGAVNPSTKGTTIEHEAVGVFGRSREAIGFGLGWGLDEYWFVGARGDVVVFPDRDQSGDPTLSRGGSFSPFVELMFARARGVRPYVMARAGIGAFASFRHTNGAWETRPKRVVVPSVGIGIGTHAFITEDLAFDLAVTLDHRFNMRPRYGGTVDGVVLSDGKLVAALVVGFSRWF